MVGALSIVRFRTAVKDPMDLAFLFWTISVGIICGAGLFEVAVEEGTIDSTLEEVQIVLDVIEANEQYIKLLTHPKLPVEQKVSLVEQVFAGKASDTLTGFMVTIVEKGRFSEIEKILTYFIDKVREYKKIGVAYVISAVELSKDEKQEIVQKLLNTTSYCGVHHESILWIASLIGGVVDPYRRQSGRQQYHDQS